MAKTPWYESDDPRQVVRGGTLFGMGWVAVITLFVLFLVAVGGILRFGFQVGTAEVKGKGQAHIQKESAPNRIFAQQRFEELKTTIDKDIANIAVASQAVKNDPNSYNQTNLAGVTQVCNSDVAEYNADARKYLLREFKAADLPHEIPLTICQ
jgi:hypothetical protein